MRVDRNVALVGKVVQHMFKRHCVIPQGALASPKQHELFCALKEQCKPYQSSQLAHGRMRHALASGTLSLCFPWESKSERPARDVRMYAASMNKGGSLDRAATRKFIARSSQFICCSTKPNIPSGMIPDTYHASASMIKTNCSTANGGRNGMKQMGKERWA